MAILSYNEVTPKKIIVWNDAPYEVLSSWVFRKQQRKPVNQTKLRNLKTGKVVEISFHQSESIPEADIEKKELVYIYTNKGEAWFHEEGNPKERISIPEDIVGHQVPYLKEKAVVDALLWDDEIIGIQIPIKVELAVVDAPPSVKGNTAQGGSKQVKLETGAMVSVPLFINEGDVIRINTDTGEYTERVNKA
ncbi:elongation factor P [Candidatus Kaiserbacteria bacterium CG10_big_fil_rev_8_21_14_0_10_45_20]|uniref:Elongation factor P n=1 Tax=Candidatus Kaiserbacteria bacterium CG10_big_fil_rev_8_21_14_0_10_45_20 TaxID=1974607 RepID=A0A2H0UF71_9BACT|nr:MAG: elongation factor P [Candidatus Kaiserbacteria bacterium CG10_big_fil_rev_8_21_14_0_10_45_20]